MKKSVMRILKLAVFLPLLPVLSTGDDSSLDSPADSSEANPNDHVESLEDLKKSLDEEMKARKSAELAQQKAENALNLERKTTASLKRERTQHQTAEEQLAEQMKELSEQKVEWQRKVNRAAAKEILAELNLTDKEFSPEDWDLFISDDEIRTTLRCQSLVTLVKQQREMATKIERERATQRDIATPPVGISTATSAAQMTDYENRVKAALRL